MQNSLNHLDKLQSDTVQQLLNSEDKDMKNYARLFDLTRSDPGQVSDKYCSRNSFVKIYCMIEGFMLKKGIISTL